MKNQVNAPTVERKKVISIMILLMISILIIIMGAAFSVLSLANNISFTVLSSQINGAVFGVVILFLGVRYFISVLKLKARVYQTTSKFSWSNFKREKSPKSILKSR